MNEKIGIIKKILYKISVERQNKYKAISSNDLNNPLNPPFLRGNCNPRCPGRKWESRESRGSNLYRWRTMSIWKWPLL